MATQATKPIKKKKSVLKSAHSNYEFYETIKATTQPLTCLAYCTAENYNFQRMLPKLQKSYSIAPSITPDLLHVRIPDSSEPTSVSGEYFIFKSGTFVSWNTTEEQNQKLLEQVIQTDVEENSFGEVELEEIAVSGLAGDAIIINTQEKPLIDKLAFSYALARSTRLAALETLLEKHLIDIKPIPRLLTQSNTFRFPNQRARITQILAQLLELRGLINLHSDSIFDVPDYFWDKPELEKLYGNMAHNLDVSKRGVALNKKLDYANELAGVLRSQLSEQHGLNLEWLIILLIAAEVGFEVVDRIF